MWRYRENPDFFSHCYGDADRLPNGNTLITDGIHYDPDYGRIVEVTPEGEKVWEVITAPFNQMYRAERIPDLDLSGSSLYNVSGHPIPFTINVTIWNSERAYNGMTFFQAKGATYGINMTGHPIWKFPMGKMCEHKLLANGHLFLAGREIREIDWNGIEYLTLVDAVNMTNGHHDAIVMPNGNVMYISRYFQEVLRDGVLTNLLIDLIREVNTTSMEVVWEWDALNHLPVENFCEFCPKYDWLHCNSITYMVEDGVKVLYLDVRNTNQILKINYDTKEIMWALGDNGDFQLFDEYGQEVDSLFSHQHDPEFLPNGRILLYDNGKHRTGQYGGYSQALELELDLDSDGDGVTDRDEALAGTSRYDSDSDNDYWSDGLDFMPLNSMFPNLFMVIPLGLIIILVYKLK
ncbi:MAG: aryl-sulfate sulfotransferase [Candidatus Bathyarchaeota archaeon]|nr:MAG: aryl-sulfate sulfotransferase [Candidatus Bathyarchaeota archaeon]